MTCRLFATTNCCSHCISKIAVFLPLHFSAGCGGLRFDISSEKTSPEELQLNVTMLLVDRTQRGLNGVFLFKILGSFWKTVRAKMSHHSFPVSWGDISRLTWHFGVIDCNLLLFPLISYTMNHFSAVKQSHGLKWAILCHKCVDLEDSQPSARHRSKVFYHQSFACT